ncbi:MAG: BolA family transcriptional regulator [Sandaracinaceae bacterium]|nr:BolA family transcriptional regulator [Sandaracinaceae bacterium]
MVEPQVLEDIIRAAVPSAPLVQIEDLTGTRDHFQATVVAEAFRGLARVEQHQLIYRALGDLMAGPVHALALSLYTPDAWEKKNAGVAHG